jgi:hypothetical protein
MSSEADPSSDTYLKKRCPHVISSVSVRARRIQKTNSFHSYRASSGQSNFFVVNGYITGHRQAAVHTVTPTLHPRSADSLMEFLKKGLGADEQSCERHAARLLTELFA